MRYPKIKTGYAFATTQDISGALTREKKSESTWCITTAPTVLKANICKAPILKKAAAKKKKKKASKVKKMKVSKKTKSKKIKKPKAPSPVIDSLSDQLLGLGILRQGLPASSQVFLVFVLLIVVSSLSLGVYGWLKMRKRGGSEK